MASKCFKKVKIQFPVAVHGTKTSVLKFPIELCTQWKISGNSGEGGAGVSKANFF